MPNVPCQTLPPLPNDFLLSNTLVQHPPPSTFLFPSVLHFSFQSREGRGKEEQLKQVEVERWKPNYCLKQPFQLGSGWAGSGYTFYIGFYHSEPPATLESSSPGLWAKLKCSINHSHMEELHNYLLADLNWGRPSHFHSKSFAMLPALFYRNI